MLAPTYYVHGTPVVGGDSATVIDGTTYSVAASGTTFWINGHSTKVHVAQTRTAAGGSSGLLSLTSSSQSSHIEQPDSVATIRLPSLGLATLCIIVGIL